MFFVTREWFTLTPVANGIIRKYFCSNTSVLNIVVISVSSIALVNGIMTEIVLMKLWIMIFPTTQALGGSDNKVKYEQTSASFMYW